MHCSLALGKFILYHLPTHVLEILVWSLYHYYYPYYYYIAMHKYILKLNQRKAILHTEKKSCWRLRGQIFEFWRACSMQQPISHTITNMNVWEICMALIESKGGSDIREREWESMSAASSVCVFTSIRMGQNACLLCINFSHFVYIEWDNGTDVWPVCL